MKSQIVPVLLFCIAFPWIAARVFQMEGHHETIRESPKEWFRQDPPSGIDNKAAGQPINYDELSKKQINYLIP
jgi:hypothetical protein